MTIDILALATALTGAAWALHESECPACRARASAPPDDAWRDYFTGRHTIDSTQTQASHRRQM